MNILKDQFCDIITALDRAKETYYLLEFLKDSFFICRGTSGIVENVIARKTQFTTALTNISKALGEDVAADINAAVTAVEDTDFYGTPFKEHFQNAKTKWSSDDRPFYTEYGKYWNECPLPASVMLVLDAVCAGMVAAGNVPGLIGAESEVSTLKDGYTGISMYDMSDYMLVFEDEASAENFLYNYGPETTELLYAHADKHGGSCWTAG